MAYSGQKQELVLGEMGLHTDDSQGQIPASALLLATNVNFYKGLIEREGGSQRWNGTAKLPAGVVCFFDYFPNDTVQRIIAVCKNGKVYRFTDAFNFTEVTASGSAPTTLNITNGAYIVSGGQENASNPKKLFIFTGNDPVQVISGDGTTRANLTNPSADWSSANYPRFGLIHQGRIFVFGIRSQPHRAYGSTQENHEDFTTLANVLTFNVYPGEFEKLNAAWVYKGKQFVAKAPRGLYELVDTDSDSTNWYYTKLNDDFGAASPNAAIIAADDVFVADTTGSITSMQAAFKLGNLDTSDLLSILRNKTYMRQNTSQAFLDERFGMFYEDKKQLYFTFRAPTGVKPDRILVIDFSHQKPKVSWSDKDQPNTLGLIKDVRLIKRPFYGADDGYIYQMDREDRVGYAIPTPAAPTASLGSGSGNLSNGTYSYKVTIYNGAGETAASVASNVVTVINHTVNGKIELSSIPVDTTGKGFHRKLYRTTAGGSTYYFLADLLDNVTTIYTDNIADSSLTTTRVASSTDTSTYFNSIFQTPYLDFGERNTKLFDFLEVTFESTGEWNVSCDIFVDGKFVQTKMFMLNLGAVLDQFVLDRDKLMDRIPRSIRKPIYGYGRSISFKFYASHDFQNFRIQKLGVHYRLSNQNQKGAK
jgi:hypothetical protein